MNATENPPILEIPKSLDKEQRLALDSLLDDIKDAPYSPKEQLRCTQMILKAARKHPHGRESMRMIEDINYKLTWVRDPIFMQKYINYFYLQ